MKTETKPIIKSLTIKQARALFVILRNETDLSGLDIHKLMKAFKRIGLIKTEELYL